MRTPTCFCFTLCIILGIKYAAAQKCSITPASFETEFCTIKQEIEAVKQFDGRISNAEHEILTLKHTMQAETAELKNNQNILQNLQQNMSASLSGGGNGSSSNVSDKLDKLLTLFKDIQGRLDHLEVKCKMCSNASIAGHPCDQKPCKNGGKCVEVSKDFHCICSSGFSGERCEFVDHCASSPCKNGGSCSSNILGHVCKCTAGFAGPYCEVPTNACDSNPCKHGRCIVQGTSHSCICDQGYTGPSCDSNGSQSSMTTISPQSTPSGTTSQGPCKADSCNAPSTCQATSPQDFKCICPETAFTKSDNCYEPHYVELYGFCCRINTCNNSAVDCSPEPSVTPYPDPCIKNANVCNAPSTCKAVNAQDFECSCPETAKSRADNCLEPYYYEQFGFCCFKNTCKNDAVEC